MEEAKAITSMMDEKRVFNPPKEISEAASIKSFDEYKELYQNPPQKASRFSNWFGVERVIHLLFHAAVLIPAAKGWVFKFYFSKSCNCPSS